MRDARGEGTEIRPDSVNLGPYDIVYLGSPIWLYSPAPPIWRFAQSNRFDGKHVVLFNTFNSKIRPEYIQAFERLVKARGAASFAHRSVRRGRMTRQMTPDAMLQTIDKQWHIEEMQR